MPRGFSPLERRALVALVSLMRDRQEPPFYATDPPDTWNAISVPLSALYERCYAMTERAPERYDPEHVSWQRQRRNERQALRRALGRLHPDYVHATALAWVDVQSGDFLDWQGGGCRKWNQDYAYRTPNWKKIGLTSVGIKAALLLEQEMSEA
jgi:hypothetical protein